MRWKEQLLTESVTMRAMSTYYLPFVVQLHQYCWLNVTKNVMMEALIVRGEDNGIIEKDGPKFHYSPCDIHPTTTSVSTESSFHQDFTLTLGDFSSLLVYTNRLTIRPRNNS